MPYLRALDVFPPDDAIVSSREADTIEEKTNEKKIVNISLILNFIVIIEIDTRDFSSGRTCKGKKQRCKPLCKGKIQKILIQFGSKIDLLEYRVLYLSSSIKKHHRHLR
jgi:hypothetical protein